MKTYLTIILLMVQATYAMAQFEYTAIPKEQKKTGGTVTYHLYIHDTTVNYTGKTKKAIAINGSIPAPVLEFTEGDTAEIWVHNTLKTESSIHWHGLILPVQFDGVPYLTTAPIKAGETKLFKFPLVQNGTYWYHSHTGLQEQIGMYGAFIIHKKEEPKIKEYVVLLSDWTNEKPEQVHRSLHNATDWYAIKKGATQNYAQAIKEGYLGTKLENEWKRMLAMDVSDVYYDRFLINGTPDAEAPEFKPGEEVRLRVINGSSSTYFWLQYGGGKLSVVANDGMDVVPVEVDRMIIGVSEIYDVIVKIPVDGSFEFRATAEDRTKWASLWLGQGEKTVAPDLPRLKYFEGMKMMNDMMNLDGSMDDMGMNMSNQTMDMNVVMYPEVTGHIKKGKQQDEQMPEEIVTLNYGMLKSPVKTTLPEAPVRELYFELTGNMNRYVWTINNKTVSESDKIHIKKGENVRIIIYNNSMMRHPMHLHGHFFRLLNEHGEYSPLKNVVDIMPMERDTIEFYASEAGGDWFFHCHILYHMMAGMGRIFSYENSPPNPELPNPEKSIKKLYKDDREWHSMAHVDILSNGTMAELMYANTRNQFNLELELGWMGEGEGEISYARFLDNMQFLTAFAGYRIKEEFWSGKNSMSEVPMKEEDENAFFIGVQYVLPFFLETELRVNHFGKVRLQLRRDDIPLTARMRLGAMVNTDKEYEVEASYILTKNLSLAAIYGNEMKFGAGLRLVY